MKQQKSAKLVHQSSHSGILPWKIEERNEINLIGVNNEKEPFMGISPVKRLFDRSLHSTWKEDNVTFLQYIWCANNI